MPSPVGKITARFPKGGLNKRLAYSDQPPETTADCSNVRPTDALEGRERGGSRPGYGKMFSENLGPAADKEIRLLDTVSFAPTDPKHTYYSSNFIFEDPRLDSFWSIPSWPADGFPSWSLDVGVLAATAVEPDSGMVASVLPLDVTKEYLAQFRVPMGWATSPASFDGAKVLLWLRMDDTTPDADDEALVFEFEITDGATSAYAGQLTTRTGGSVSNTYAFSTGTLGASQDLICEVSVTVDAIVVKISGTTVLTQTLTAPDHSAIGGTRMGVGFDMSAGAQGAAGYFYVDYFSTDDIESRRIGLAAQAGGDLYFEYTRGTLEQVGTDAQELHSAPGVLMSSAEWVQKLYIADRGSDIVDKTDGLINAKVLTNTGATDFAAAGVDADLHVVEIYAKDGDVQLGVYKIASVVTTTINLLVSTLGTSDNCSFRVRRSPKVFDPSVAKGSADAIDVWIESQYDADDVAAGIATVVDQHKGSMPLNCPIVTRYRNRLVLCRDNLWFMSRAGDPLDWDYFQPDDDTGRAVAGSSTDAGVMAKEITAAIAYSKNYMIFAHLTELWLVRGDPAYGGSIDNISRTIGCVDMNAWTYTPKGDLIFLSTDGLYALRGGSVGEPEMISKEILPRELLGVDKTQVHVSMAYDTPNRGIHIYLTPITTGSATHWWFDFQTKSMWPVTIADDGVQPIRAIVYDDELGQVGAYLGCRDGYIRGQKSSFQNDDGTAFTSYFYIGPIYLGGDEDMEGIVSELMCTLGENSSEVDWTIYSGDTAELALASSTVYSSGEWTAGRNIPEHRPASRAVVVFIKIANGAVTPWEFERLRIEITKGDRARPV